MTLSPVALPPPPPDITNAFADNAKAAALGKALFSDRSFAGPLVDADNDGTHGTLGRVGDTGRVACADCHLPDSGFVDARSPGHALSLGAGWGVRRAPSLLDVGQGKLLTWDGRHDAFFNQVFGPIESPVEMNSSRLYVAERLAIAYRAQYEDVFGPMPAFDDATQYPQLAATLTGCQPKYGVPATTCNGSFHGMPGDGAEFDSLVAAKQEAVNRAVASFGKAVGAYLRTLSCGQSRFDQWAHGDAAALTASEQRGAGLFADHCATCHSGPFLSDFQFHNVGVQPVKVGFSPADIGDKGASDGIAGALADPLNSKGIYSDGDDGRLPATVPTNLLGAFETPKLRCVQDRPTFLHTAQLHTLLQVVDFFNNGGEHSGFPGQSELQPLGLTADDEDDLVAFLETLGP
jgi:cytochrome c peroxidase